MPQEAGRAAIYLLNSSRAPHESGIRRSPSTAALTATSWVAPITHRLGDEVQQPFYDADAAELLHDVRNCLTLAGPVRLASFEDWLQFVDDDLACLNFPASHYWAEIQPYSLKPLGTFDVNVAKAVVASYVQMSNPLKSIVRMAIDR